MKLSVGLFYTCVQQISHAGIAGNILCRYRQRRLSRLPVGTSRGNHDKQEPSPFWDFCDGFDVYYRTLHKTKTRGRPSWENHSSTQYSEGSKAQILHAFHKYRAEQLFPCPVYRRCLIRCKSRYNKGYHIFETADGQRSRPRHSVPSSLLLRNR